MKNAIANMISIMKSNSTLDVKIAKEIARIPAVEINSIQVYHAYLEEDTAPSIRTGFMGVTGYFDWHGNRIEFKETLNGKIVVSYNGVNIGEIFWSALWGKLESMPNYTQLKLSKAQEYILDCLWKVVHKVSAKGRPYEKVALPKKVTYGDTAIWAEGATVYAEYHGEKLRVMGNTINGLTWTLGDGRVSELQKVIKKAFIVY